MIRIGIIVDGDGDHASLTAKFKGMVKILKTDGPRGHSAQCDKIVLYSKKQIAMLHALRCSTIILLLDRESRPCSAQAFSEELSSFSKAYFPELDIHFAVADRMIENWYLSDLVNISKKKNFIKDDLRQKSFEGTHGKNELKSCFKKGHSYSETLHGPQLFVSIRDKVAVKNSHSYKKFLDLIYGC